MALHLIGTVYHLGETVVHAASGNAPAAMAGLVKTGASIIPGGGFIAHAVTGKIVDEVIVNGNTKLAENVARTAWENRDNIIDSFGDGDGVAEFSDVIDGLSNLFS